MSTMTTADERRHIIRGKRIPGKPGRFDPDRPLHMTTRGAAKKHKPDGESPSVNGSSDDNESRRGSFDDELRPTTTHSSGSQPSPYVDNASAPMETYIDNTSAAIEMATSPSPAEANDFLVEDVNDIEVNELPTIEIHDAPSPSRKRKRSTPSPPVTPNGLAVPLTSPGESTVDHEDGDFVAVVDPGQLSDREASESSSEPGELLNGGSTLAAPSANITPTLSVANSPPSSTSASQNDLPIKDVVLRLDAIDQSEEGEAVEYAEEVEEVDEVEGALEDGRLKRRWGGRKRQRHPEQNVELAMQRQLHLKKAYRTLAREMKAIAADIAHRTLEELIEGPKIHEQAAEHPHVMAGLRDALDRRRACMEAQHRLDADHLRQRLEAERRVMRSKRQLDIHELRDKCLNQLEHDMVVIARTAHLAEDGASHSTEHGNDIIPQSKQKGYRFQVGDALDSINDSRSRQPLEKERAAEDLYRQILMRKMLDDLKRDERPGVLEGFTVMDKDARDATIARQQSIALTQTLGEAANEVERRSLLLVPNEAAIGLQVLGDLALRPSIRADVKPHSHSGPAQTPSRQVPPPITLPPPNPRPVPVELSPRTSRLVGDRFDIAMLLPPPTPRQGSIAFVCSPEVPRHEPALVSPRDRREVAGSNSTRAVQNHPEREFQFRTQPLPLPVSNTGGWREYRKVDDPESRETTSGASVHGSSSWHDPVRDITGVHDRRLRGSGRRRPSELAHRAPVSESGAAPPCGDPTLPTWRPQGPTGTLDTLHIRPPSPTRPGDASLTTRCNHLAETHPFERPQFSQDNIAPPRPRKASVSQPDHKPASGQSVDQQRRPSENRQTRRKTNKEDRGGQSRRSTKKTQKQKRPPALGTAMLSAPPPQPLSANLAQSPIEQPPQPPPFWLNPTSQPSSLPSPSASSIPPLAPYRPQYTQRPIQPPGFGRPEPDYRQPHHQHQHRNSFPPLQPPPPGWNPPSQPSPLYAIPQRPLPPPPGISTEQYTHPFAHTVPPPPPFPPSTTSSSSTAHHPVPAAAAAAPYTQQPQFGGQPIAPATADHPRFHAVVPGFRPAGAPNHVPAFAQHPRQQPDGGSWRRPRRQSEAVVTEHHWQHWEPSGHTASSSGGQKRR